MKAENFFARPAVYKKEFIQTNFEQGYRDLPGKEMFLIRDHHVPSELSVCLELIKEFHQLSLYCLDSIAESLQINPEILHNLVDEQALSENQLLVQFYASSNTLKPSKVRKMLLMAGESLSLISNGYYIPASHRVRTPKSSRLAINYHLRMKNGAVIDSNLLTSAMTGKFPKPFCMTANEFLQKRN